jgi:hypothetical protein
MMAIAPKSFAEWARMLLLPFKVFACVGWLASDLEAPVIIGYALSTVVLLVGGVAQYVCRHRPDSLVSFAAALWSFIILWKLLPMLAR